MDRRVFCFGALAGLAAFPRVVIAQERGRRGDRLYNEQDLTGWHVKGGRLEAWKADGPILSCVQPGGGWLTTDREYADFVLRLEYRIGPGGNSGVGIRYPAEGDPAHEGMEIQILDDAHPQYANLQAAQYNGGIYYQAAPTAKPARPAGEWNRYVIRCQGPNIRVRLNGTEVQNINVEEFTTAQGNYKPLADRPRRGFLGLQSHGDPVDFRNIFLREL